jgi:hypothetical protein
MYEEPYLKFINRENKFTFSKTIRGQAFIMKQGS